MMTMNDALAVIDALNAKYTAVVPAGHLGIRVIDMEKQEIAQDILVLDTPADRVEMEFALALLLALPVHFLVLTNIA